MEVCGGQTHTLIRAGIDRTLEAARAHDALRCLRSHPLGGEAAIIGHVVDEHPGRVVMRSRIGGSRVVDMLCGEHLPRIC
jgi:hydrogenase expression/formation protein HypE